MKRFTSIAAAVFTAAFLAAASNASAQGTWDQTTFLTFSGPVQVPGATLPAGTYVFKYPTDNALHNIIQVFDKNQQHLYSQFFFVPTVRTEKQQDRANGKPVVMFYESAEGTSPAIEYYYYPDDLRGKKFIYPKDQARMIAAATHRSVIATDTDVAKGGEAHTFQVNPNGTESSYSANETASNAAQNTPPASASASSASPVSPAPDQSAASNHPAATTGAYDQNQTPQQQASAQLPKTASPIQLIGLIGLLSLAGGFGLRAMARDNA